MSNARINIEGYLSKDPQSGVTQSGDQFLNLSIPHTPRKKNKQSGEWEDAGDTLWVQATAWGKDAEALAPLLSKGSLVRVEGEPVLRAWESNGKSGVNLEVKFPRVSIVPRAAAASQPPAGEPWATSAPAVPAASGDVWSQPGTFNDETPF